MDTCRKTRNQIVFAIIALIVFVIGTSSQLIHGINGKVTIVSTSSAEKEEASLQRVPDTTGARIECIAGISQKRRQLAKIGKNATKEQWLNMMECMEEREMNSTGIYALHVSKSGGTSLCDLFKEEQCFVPPNNPNANCWSNRYKSSTINLGPQWQRKSFSKSFRFPKWVTYDENAVPSSSCGQIKNYLRNKNQKIAMSENWLPKGGSLCQNDFHNIVVIRDPMSRILSHYQHLFKVCMSENKGLNTEHRCLRMLHGGVWNENSSNSHSNSNSNNKSNNFNLTFMMEWFDIISDNYYVRSMNDQIIYKEPFGMNGKGSKYFQNAMHNLRSFDWILILQSGGSDDKSNSTSNNNSNNNHNDKMNRQMILKNGLGLSQDFGVSRKRHDKKTDIGLLENDIQILKNVNKFDLKIWHEAKRLSNLDVESLKIIETYDAGWFTRRTKGVECCGRICTGIGTSTGTSTSTSAGTPTSNHNHPGMM